MSKQKLKFILIGLIILIILGIYLIVSLLGVKALLVIVVIFILLLIIFAKNATKFSNKAYESRFVRLKECKKCKAIIPFESEICPKCGYKYKEIK